MNYYHYDPDANTYKGYRVQSKDEERVLSIHFDDGPVPKKTVKVYGFDDNPLLEGDFPSLSNYRKIPICSQHALEVLWPLIGSYANALPIRHPSGGKSYFLQIKAVIDCVDLNASEVTCYSDGRVMKIVKYRLIAERIKGKHMFKTPRESGGDLLVDEIFKETVEANQLKGLRFEPIPTL